MSDSHALEAEPLDAEALLEFSERIEALPPDIAAWVAPLFQECLRARLSEAQLLADAGTPPATEPAAREDCDAELAQVALDVAEWLKTLWDVGYMGPAAFLPRRAAPSRASNWMTFSSRRCLPASARANALSRFLPQPAAAVPGTP